MQKNVTQPRYFAFRRDFLFGLSLGIFVVIGNVLLSLAKVGIMLAGGISFIFAPGSTGKNAGGFLVPLLMYGGFLVPLLVYLVAGLRASQQTGKVGIGTFAGLWTGLICGGISFVYIIVVIFVPGSYSLYPQFGEVFPLLVLVSIPGILLAIVLGAVVGTLGGLIGKRFASPHTNVSQDAGA
jgi:hypothetical protein